jgi:hypothetical protein
MVFFLFSYKDYLHEIESTDKIILNEDSNIKNLDFVNYKLNDEIIRKIRVSLTIRVVKKSINKNLIKF